MWKKLTLAGLLIVAFFSVALGLAWREIRGSGLAQRSGAATLPGLGETVRVRFDEWGVPHVEAATLRDAAAAQGWLHANDRMTQMELGRRSAAGRLAEVVGPVAVPLDRASRVLRLEKAAANLYRWASPESTELLDAYASGVNAWLGARGNDLPPGLRLLRIEPEPWRPEDSLSFVLLMAVDLSFWQGRPEEERFGWLEAFGEERLRELLGKPDLHIPEDILTWPRPPQTPLVASSPGQGSQPFSPPPLLGSNGWVLGGSRTDGGAPLVANDPHLGLHLPNVWFQVLIRTPEYEAAGMSLPGLPGVVIGRSPHLAWAFTNTMLDDHDLFFEELDDSGLRVRRGDSFVPLEVQEQEIGIRGEEPETITLYSTDRGPLLEADPKRGLPPRSLAWTIYLPSDPMAALTRLAQARDLEEVPAAVESFVAPAQNLMVGHRDGGLLYLTLGRIPDRRRGNGRMPSPGWDPSYGWDGLLPQSANPTIRRPESDLIVTANNDIRPEGYSQPFSAEFDTSHRANRIRQLLSAKRDWTAKDQESVQRDATSLWAQEVIRACTGSYQGDAAAAHDLLAAWDGIMGDSGEGSAAAALFTFFERELQEAVFRDEEEAHGVEPLRSRRRLGRLLRGEMSPDWFDDVSTEPREGRQEILEKALASAWQTTRRRLGENPESWSYGEIHALELQHPLGLLPVVSGFFNRGPYPLAGSATTINAMMGRWQSDEQGVVAGPSMRWVVDFAQPSMGLAVLPGGQSGHPADPHYDDQLPLYLRGELRDAPWSEDAIAAATEEALELHP